MLLIFAMSENDRTALMKTVWPVVLSLFTWGLQISQPCQGYTASLSEIRAHVPLWWPMMCKRTPYTVSGPSLTPLWQHSIARALRWERVGTVNTKCAWANQAAPTLSGDLVMSWSQTSPPHSPAQDVAAHLPPARGSHQLLNMAMPLKPW